MVGWQDPLAWWLCDLSPQLGRAASSFFFSIAGGGWFEDFASSAAYYADVIGFSDIDPEFVAAHRLCAFMSMHTLVFAALVGGMACIVLPYAAIAIAEIFTGAITLLFSALGSQILADNNDNDDA